MTEAFKPVGVTILRAVAPYQAGDVVGLLPEHAHDLVRQRVADFFPPRPDTAVSAALPTPPDVLDAMDRADLVAFGREHLGMKDEPSADITDAALREAIRANVDPSLLDVNAPIETEEAGNEDPQQPPSDPGKQGKGGKPKP